MFHSKFLWILLLIAITTAAAAVSDSKNVKSKYSSMLRLPSQNDGLLDSTETCPALNPALNYKPLIGILSHPGDGTSGRLSNATNVSYIAASYVKFVESAGARVIPIIFDEPLEVVQKKLNIVNGVLFTGGWAKKGLYADLVEWIFKQVLEINDAGENVPVLAISLGFELLVTIISKDGDILEPFAAYQASTVQFLENTNIEGTVFERFPPELLKKLSTDCLVLQNHRYGISPQTFAGNANLSSFFNVLTTSTDANNKAYVSTVQARKYPVIGLQWHPEKNAFEWGSSKIPHSEDAIQVTQQVANYFISEARKSTTKPPNYKVLENLIYNYSPTFSGKAGKGYDQVYLFST